MRDLGTFGGPASGSCYINDLGQVVGWADIYPIWDEEYHAFLWKKGTGLRDLGTFGWGPETSSMALDINSSGHVVGEAQYYNMQNFHAFIWEQGTGMKDLNDLLTAGSGWLLKYAYDINENGWIVGWARYEGHWRGFLLTPGNNNP